MSRILLLLITLVPVAVEYHYWYKFVNNEKETYSSKIVRVWDSLMFIAQTICYGKILLGGIRYGETSFMLWSAGYAIIWIGTLLRVASFYRLRQFYSWSVKVRENHQVINTGPYKYLRHPMHIGMNIQILGHCIMFGYWFAFPIFIAYFIITIIRNIQEEKILKTNLGPPYEKYCTEAWDVVDVLPRNLVEALQ